MENVYELLPKNKHNNSNIDKLKKLSDKEIAPLLADLLTWIQDCNWPVAKDILPILALHQSSLIPLIKDVLSVNEKDDIWKYWIINALLPLFSYDNIAPIIPAIKRIAQNPTQGEVVGEVNEEAIIFLNNKM